MSLRVMIVEDDAALRTALEALLLSYGHSVCWSATALGAIDLMRTETVDLVLLDFELEGSLDGRYVAKHVARTIPVFMISGHSVEDMRARVSNTLEGVTLFFSKPVDVENLMVAIDRVERTLHAP